MFAMPILKTNPAAIVNTPATPNNQQNKTTTLKIARNKSFYAHLKISFSIKVESEALLSNSHKGRDLNRHMNECVKVNQSYIKKSLQHHHGKFSQAEAMN